MIRYHVLHKSITFLLIMFLFPASAFAAESVRVDNDKIQRYNNKIGRWVRCDSQARLRLYMKRFRTPSSDVQSGSSSGYYFIPFSKEYLESLHSRDIIHKKTPVSSTGFIWPIQGTSIISSSFGMRHGKLHAGFDIPAVTGTPIVAAMDGRVISTGYAGGYGLSVLIEHRNGYLTRYSHNSAILVKKDDCVLRGQIIGLVGSTGHSTGSHLDFEIRYSNIPLNPLDYMPEKSDIQITHKSLELD